MPIIQKQPTIGYNQFLKYKKWEPVNVFTTEEVKLYDQLSLYLASKDCIVLPKMRLADLVDTRQKVTFGERQSTLMRLTQKHVDFVISNHKWKILCLIELDWNSHKTDKKTIRNDKFKNEFFGTINLPLLRFQNGQKHNLHRLDKYLEKNQ